MFAILPSSGVFASQSEIATEDLRKDRQEHDEPASFYTCPIALPEPAPPPRSAVFFAAVALVVMGVCIGRALGFLLFV